MVGFNDLIGTGTASTVGAIIGIFTLFTLGILTFMLWLTVTRWKKFNHWVILFSQTKAGLQLQRLKGGWIKNKEGNKEFQTLKPKFIINTFNPEWVVPQAIRRFGSKPEVYAFHHKDNIILQLEPECIHKTGNKLSFVPRQLGKDRFEEAFQKSTAEFWDFRSWMDKNKDKLLVGGAFMTLMMFNFILLIKVMG